MFNEEQQTEIQRIVREILKEDPDGAIAQIANHQTRLEIYGPD